MSPRYRTGARFTPAQTAGPYSDLALMRTADAWSSLSPDGGPDWAPTTITIRGRVIDGQGHYVDDAVLEAWSAATAGEGCACFRRTATDVEGWYELTTWRPVATASAAPHIAILIFAGGLNRHLVTRLYLPDEPGNATDPTLLLVEDPDRRSTLIAEPDVEPGRFRFDIRLQGERETVFFDV